MKLPIQAQPVMRYVSTAKITSSNIQPSNYFQCIRTCQEAGNEIGGVGGAFWNVACNIACDAQDVYLRL